MRLTRRGFIYFSGSALVMRALLPAFGQSVSQLSTQVQAKPANSSRQFAAHFVDIAKEAGLTEPVIYGEADHKDYILETVGCGCAFFDYDNDGWMDIFVLNGSRSRGVPEGTTNRLYRNNRDGTFTDVSRQAGIGATRASYGMTVVAADVNEDGWPDIYVACDSTPSLLFVNQHNGKFKEEGIARGVALSEDGKEQAGMGVGVGDYNLDGHLQISLTIQMYFMRTTERQTSRTRRLQRIWGFRALISVGVLVLSIWITMGGPTSFLSRAASIRKSKNGFRIIPTSALELSSAISVMQVSKSLSRRPARALPRSTRAVAVRSEILTMMVIWTF